MFSEQSSAPNQSILPVRAVNLGGWLVVEGWIQPTLFDGIPNKDFLDGALLQFKSVTTGKYLRAENGGGANIVAERSAPRADGSEIFRLWRIDEKKFNLRVANKQFVGIKSDGNRLVDAKDEPPQQRETLEIHRESENSNRVRIKASNGSFVQVKTNKLVAADYEGHDGWGDDNPSVFLLTITTTLRGEYHQLTNGYGPDRAKQVMKEHWDTFIKEDDFKFIKDNGLNAVRIPVGWWIASESPPEPYVAGSLQYLDKAFTWAEKYGIKIIIDLHAAPGSQSGWEPSSARDDSEDWEPDYNMLYEKLKPQYCSSRDGFHNWTYMGEHIQETIDAIAFLTAQYARSPSLLAVELLNEPVSPLVHLDVLKDFYRRAFRAVRRHSKTAYVIMCNRLGKGQSPTELLSFAQEELWGAVVDDHYYNLYDPEFDNFTVQDNIDFVKNDRANELKELTKPNGPLVFVGEWVAEWQVKEAFKEEYQKFAEAQLQVYSKATFGWSYWTLKNVNNHWSLEWMIKNGYIKITPP